MFKSQATFKTNNIGNIFNPFYFQKIMIVLASESAKNSCFVSLHEYSLGGVKGRGKKALYYGFIHLFSSSKSLKG